jgi:hypothetical protein
MTTPRMATWLTCSILATVVGCGGDNHPAMDGGPDGSSDRAGDVMADGTPDLSPGDGSPGDGAPRDAAPDAVMDTGMDVANDVGMDVGMDVAKDVGTDAVDGGAPDTGTDAGSDADGGMVPAALTATILDRRQTSVRLVWPAPATTAGGSVAGYDIRVAKVMITTANFDDTAVTKAVTYTGTPAAPGQADGATVTGLNIEQAYYFAVSGKDAGGTRVGTLMATATAVQAQFMTTVLSGNGTDGIGQDVDGTGDFGRASDLGFTADGFSDLLVGTIGGNRVYVYFGSAAGYASTPSITITGMAGTDFGSSVINAGDLDGDNLADIAVAAPNDGGGGRIYVFSRKSPPASWGTTNTWPTTLTQAQANYVVTVDATFAGGAASIQPGGLARLGNFDGTGADDLAVGLILHASEAGSLLVVKGSTAFASRTIPDAQTIEIDGAAATQFGWPVVGIGQFFPTPAGPGLISSSLPSNVYAFRGQAPTAVLTVAAADDSVVGPTADGYGISLGFLGPLSGSPGAVSISAFLAAAPYVDVHLGTTTSGPFLGAAGAAPAQTVRFTDSASGNGFGVLNLGGGVKGTSQTVSLVGGDALPDLVVAGNGETGTPIYLINGAAISSLTGSINVSAAQPAVVPPIIKVANRLPASWGGYAGASIIPHSNDDTYGDFAIGEYAINRPGRVVIFY